MDLWEGISFCSFVPSPPPNPHPTTWFAVSAESMDICMALFACGYGTTMLRMMDKQLYDLGIIPRVDIQPIDSLPDSNSQQLRISQEMESAKPKYDYTLVDMETALLSLAAAHQQCEGVCYFMAYESGLTGKVFVR